MVRKYWHPDEAEDIAQSVLLAFIKNPQSKQTVEQAVIDYVRQNGGRSRGGALRIKLLDRKHCLPEEYLSTHSSTTRSTGHELQSFERYLNNLETSDRCIAVLRFVWELSVEEIGYCFGVSDSRISQRLTSIQAKISRTLEAEKQTEGSQLLQTISAKTKTEPNRTQERPVEMAQVLSKQIQDLEQRTNKILEAIESREMESLNEEGFDEWLT